MKVTDPDRRTGYEPNRIVDNQIINEQEDITSTEDNQITEIEGHVKTYPTTSHCCLLLKFLLKALPRLKKQTWTTNKFVLCWLHHGTYWCEKQLQNDRKFIILKKKA